MPFAFGGASASRRCVPVAMESSSETAKDRSAKAVKAAGGAIWAPNQTYLTPQLLAEAKSLGLTVIPWTVNSPDMMTKLIDMGVDGIISDRPDLVKAELAKRK